MAAVHFTTTPCKTNTVNMYKESHSLWGFRPCTYNIMYDSFEVFGTFLCVFMSIFRVLLACVVGARKGKGEGKSGARAT